MGLSKHKMATLALRVIIANRPQAFIHRINIPPKRERENEREGVGKEGNSFSEQQLHLKTTQEGNNTSSQGSVHQRELAFEVLCKIFTCFLLLTTGLMKKKEEKHAYFFLKKGSHSIIHHFIGFQPDYPKRNVISSPPNTYRRLALNYGVGHCLAVCVRNCAQRDAQDSYLEWYLFLPWPCPFCLHHLSMAAVRSKSANTPGSVFLQTAQFPRWRIFFAV